MSVQNRLFTYTRNGHLMTGSEVIKAERTKQIIKLLQKEKQMVENWTLDIFCRDPAIINDIKITTIDPVSALGAGWRYGISIVNMPRSTCISPYELTVAWFQTQIDSESMLDIIQYYLGFRYGIGEVELPADRRAKSGFQDRGECLRSGRSPSPPKRPEEEIGHRPSHEARRQSKGQIQGLEREMDPSIAQPDPSVPRPPDEIITQ